MESLELPTLMRNDLVIPELTRRVNVNLAELGTLLDVVITPIAWNPLRMDSITGMNDLITEYNSRMALLCDAASIDHVPVTLNAYALDLETTLSLMAAQDEVLAAVGEDGGGGDPAWLPPGATVFADYQNGHYYAGGQEVLVADVLLETSYVSAGALNILQTDTPAHVIGAMASAILALDWTIVIDMQADLEVDFGGAVLGITDDDLFDQFNVGNRPTGTDPVMQWFTERYNAANDFSEIPRSASSGAEVGRTKIAVTYSVNKVSLSVNGFATLTDTTPVVIAPTKVLLSNNNENAATDQDLKYYSITLYPPKLDADLPALSAL